MAIIALVFLLLLVVGFFIAAFKVGAVIFLTAPYAISMIAAALLGPRYIYRFTENGFVNGIIYAVIVIPIVFLICQIWEIFVPFLILIYTPIFYNLLWIPHKVVFWIFLVAIVGGGTGFCIFYYGGMFWRKGIMGNPITRIVLNVISFPIYWYAIVVLESCYFQCIKPIDKGWDLFWRNWNDLKLLKGLPSVHVSFLIAGVIVVVMTLLDLFVADKILDIIPESDLAEEAKKESI